MLSREDSRRLAQMERQLMRDDPDFCARMAAGPAGPLRRRRPPIFILLAAVVTWMAAAVLGVLGWWIAAAAAAICATVLLAIGVRRVTRRRAVRGNTDNGDPDI